MQAAGKRWIVYGSRSDEFKLWGLGDIHLGTKACAESKLQEDINCIKNDPFSVWVGLGDICDYISLNDRRFDPRILASWIKVEDLADLGTQSAKYALKMLKPIKDKCLGLMMGNHEWTYMQRNNYSSLHGWLCTEMGVPSLEYSCMFDVVFVRNFTKKNPKLSFYNPSQRDYARSSFRVYAHHGSGGATTPGGKLNKLLKIMKANEADIYFTGHSHDKIDKELVTIKCDADCKKIQHRKKWGVISGSYLRTCTQDLCTYPERAGYDPVPLGARYIRIWPDKNEFSA